MWISVVLIILVIVLGLVAGSRLSAPGPQRRAVNAAFISLAAMALLFFILINVFPGDWIVPFFTVACIVVPICIYVGFTRAAVSAGKAAGKKSFEIPRADMTWNDEDEVVTPAPAKAVASAPAPAVAAKPKAEPSKATSAAQPKSQHKVETPKPKSATVAAAAKTEEEPAAAVQAKPKAEPTPKPAVKPEPKPEPKVAKAPETTATPKPEKPVQKPAPAKVEKPAEAPMEKSAEATSGAKATPASAPALAPEKPRVEPKVVQDIQASLTAKSAESAATKKPAPEFSAAASADLLSGKPATDEASSHKSLLTEIEALVERDLNVGRKIAEGASDEEVRAAEAAPLNYHTENIDISLPASVQIPTTKPTTKPEAATLEPAPAPEPKPEPKPEPLDPFTELCNKAASLRDQGSYAVAAVIFKKAVDAAPSANDARTAQFDELSCYVKAGEAAKAKALATQLRQSSVLTRFERIKLDAVERMG